MNVTVNIWTGAVASRLYICRIKRYNSPEIEWNISIDIINTHKCTKYHVTPIWPFFIIYTHLYISSLRFVKSFDEKVIYLTHKPRVLEESTYLGHK